MTEEIKEILDNLVINETTGMCYLSIRLTNQTRNIITNLHQENEKLNRMCELYSKSLYNAELSDYKSRCEKAIEYIMSNLITEWDIKNDGCVSGSDLSADAITPILNILNGSDEK